MSRLVLDEQYNIEFPSGTSVKAELYHIQKYPATGMPPDYHFRTLKGEVNPFSSSTADMFKPDEFPLPEFLIGNTKFTPIKDFIAPSDNEVFEEFVQQLRDGDPSTESNYMGIHETIGNAIKGMDAKDDLSTGQKMAYDEAIITLVEKLEKLKSELETR